MRSKEMVRCPSCGKKSVERGLMGGACYSCGDTARDRAIKEAKKSDKSKRT